MRAGCQVQNARLPASLRRKAAKRLVSVKLIGTLALATLAAAPASAQGPGWTANSTVTKLVVTANGGINVMLSPNVTACVSQSGYGPNFASILPNHPGINRMKADLLAAYVNGTTIALYLVDSNCTVGELILGGW